MANPSAFAARVIEIMNLKKLKVKDLARIARLKPATLYEWLRSETMPGSRLLTELSAALEVTTDYLLGKREYVGLDSHSIVSQEALTLYLRRSGNSEDMARLALLQSIARLKTAPLSVEAWADIDQQLIPMVSSHNRKRERGGRQPARTPTLTILRNRPKR
jgi:transcriptional regulator with XRE-family HTH domain